MEEEKVLLVEEIRQEKPELPGELKVAAMPNAENATPQVSPKKENVSQFLKVDLRSSALVNFIENFTRNVKNKYKFYLRSLSEVKEEIEKGLPLKREGEINPDDLKKENAIAPDKEGEVTPEVPKKENAIDSGKVNWKPLEQLGITTEILEKKNELDRLLNYRKTGLFPLSVQVGGNKTYFDARISLRKQPDGTFEPIIHPVRKEISLDYPYMGHSFTPEEKERLLKDGNLGQVIEVTPKNAEPYKAYVAVDPLTNEIVSMPQSRQKMPSIINGVELSQEEQNQLREGKPVLIQGMKSKAGKSFDAVLQMNAHEKGLKFHFVSNKGVENKEAVNQEFRIHKRLKGVELTDAQRAALDAGKTLYIKGMVNKEGASFDSYVKWDYQQSRPRFYQWNPDKQQEKKPEENKRGNKAQREQEKKRKNGPENTPKKKGMTV